jgi:uncharacterized protein GlcG (DUF336 family)
MAGGTVALVAAAVLGMQRPTAVAQQATIAARLPAINAADRDRILAQAVASASTVNSGLRLVGAGFGTTRMHIAVVDRAGRVLGFRSMEDAWEGSRDIAIAKARTAAFFSSNQNALTSRTIGVLSQAHGADGTGGAAPLWGIWDSNEPGITGNSNTRNGIIVFPGGVPLYKEGVLVGGVGVSGDGVDQDEAVAVAASLGFEAPADIRASKLGLPYTK